MPRLLLPSRRDHRPGRRTPGGRVLVLIAASMLALTACADDDDAGDTTTTTEDTTTTTQATTTTTRATTTTAGDDTVTITAVDYAYPDAPDTLTAGTTVVLQNDSTEEVHEILVFRIPDDEDRSAGELLALPPEELMQIVEMRGAALAPPGGESTAMPTPPLTFEQPGRYLFACLIPTGAPPAEVLAAVQEFVEGGMEGEPEYPQTGPPHAANGMFTEVTVTGG